MGMGSTMLPRLLGFSRRGVSDMNGDTSCAERQHDIVYTTRQDGGIESVGCLTCEVE